MQRSSRPSRQSRQSIASAPIHTLEHDAIAVALQESLGGRVILIRPIGEGGMGRVYLARDPQLKRFVAVKVLLQSHGADAEAQARFRREAQAIAAISHPNVLAIYGVGELPNGTPYFIMQYVAGGSMSERLAAKGPLPVDAAESVIGDVAAALHAAHRRGIIHRDVKPANVLWDEESERATVSDFGIATLQPTDGDETDIRITGSGMAVGSPAYMSPEQLLAEPVTPKSDIYALGLLGYELLTGRGPYNANAPNEVVAAHLRDRPRRLSEVRTDIPEALQELLLQCLAKEPAARPSAEEVMLALTPGAADALEWPPPGLEKLRGALWRLMLMPAVGVVFLLLPLVLAVMSGGGGGSSFAVPLLIAASALLGFVALLRAGRQAWNLGTALARATRLAYGGGTLAEVASDARGDTGALIAGTREYSPLTVREQSLFRVLRVVRASALFLAAPTTLIVAILALVARGGVDGGDELFVRAVLTTPTAFVIIGVAAGLVEHLRLAATRRRRIDHPRGTNERELAPAWYAAFERSREGQWFGPGDPLPRLKTLAFVLAGTLGVVFCASVLFTASVIVVTGQILSTTLGEAFVDVGSSLQRGAGGSTFRVNADSSVTPVEAGDAMLAVASTRTPRAPSPVERRISADYPRWSRVVPAETLFARNGTELWTTAAINTAARGLTSEQRELLNRAAAHPAREEFSRAASARSVDLYGALLKLPVPSSFTLADYPTLNLSGLRDAAESHAARVALDVADGKAMDGERHAREIIAVGALLLDVPTLKENVVGMQLLENGVSALGAVYVATNRERDARLLLENIVQSTPRRRFFLSGRERYERALRDTTGTRGTRMEALVPLVFAACSDPRQLFFGTDDAYRRVMSYARDSIARYPSERIRVDLMEGALSTGLSREFEDTPAAITVMARMVDAVVGGRRFESCANITRLLNAL